MDMFQEFVMNQRYQDLLKTELCSKVHKFRQLLRKSHKKLRKGSNDITYEDDPETVVAYLEIVNDFIRANL